MPVTTLGVIMKHRFSVFAAVILVGALSNSSPAHAGWQPISGKKLLLKSSPSGEKLVLLSKDPLIDPGLNGTSADPRCEDYGGNDWGGGIALNDGTNRTTLTMNCEPYDPGDPDYSGGWKSNGPGTEYKFKYTEFPATPAPGPKVVKVKSGVLKIVSKDLGGFSIPNGSATIRVEVRVGLDNKYCMEFTGTGDGSKFRAIDASAPSSCPTTAPGCAGESVGGACWYLGEDDESCDDVCFGLGKTCDPATVNYAGSGPGGTLTRCADVLSAFFVDSTAVDSVFGPTANQLGCVVDREKGGNGNRGPYGYWVSDGTTTCAAAHYGYQRVCACN